VAAVLITSLVCGAVAACGRTAPTVKPASASPDPIVGTWRQQWLVGDPPPEPPLVMTKTKSGYLGTFVLLASFPGETPPRYFVMKVPLHWRSFILTGRYHPGPGRAQVIYDADTKFLRWADSISPGRGFGPWKIWVKVSDSTVLPTPSP
jgi:hypothetical protein